MKYDLYIFSRENFINININENQFDEFDNLKKATVTKGNLMK